VNPTASIAAAKKDKNFFMMIIIKI
jgi:hypothetical protein